MRIALLWSALLWATAAGAQTVSLSGTLGANKALLIINGKLQTVSVGTSVEGVRLVKFDTNEAWVEVNGKQLTLRLGASPVNLGSTETQTDSGKRIVLTAGSGGHFTTTGTVNGKSISFLVDTGATSVAISQTQADSMGLKYRDGKKLMGHTANGNVVMHQIKLNTVRIGEVQIYDVDAVVVPADMPNALLGNSFLSRFQMKRDNDVLTLERRY
jgi:aspartyl protease family protein